jgi:cell division protein FtsB
VQKVLADMHVPPAVRRWGTRAVLVITVAVLIAGAPWLAGGRDDRAERMTKQLDQIRDRLRDVRTANAGLADDIDALRHDVSAIERRARDDLGMIYPGELVLVLEPR